MSSFLYFEISLVFIHNLTTSISVTTNGSTLYMYTAISRKVVGKNAQATIPKGNIGALAREARAAEHHG